MNLSMIVLGSLSGGLMSILKEDIKKKKKKKQVGNWGKKKRLVSLRVEHPYASTRIAIRLPLHA